MTTVTNSNSWAGCKVNYNSDSWTELESYVAQIIKGYGCERDREYIEQNAGNLNAVILYFRTGVQSDSE